MTKRVYNLLVLTASLLFIVLNSYFIYHDKSMMTMVPLVLLAATIILFAPNFAFYSLFLLIPLSIPMREIMPNMEFDFWFPTEPVIFALMLVLILKSLYLRYFEKKLTNSPIFWAILFYLGWIFIASIGSEMPLVSFKYLLVRIWFIAAFFYLTYLMLLKSPSNIYKMMGLYTAGLSVVVLITLARQAQRGFFSRYVAHGSCVPFFPDHTSYGATLAYIIPITLAMALSVKNKKLRLMLYAVAAFFTFALVMTFTRAAWLSLVLAGGIWLLWRLRIKLRTIIIAGAVIAAVGFSFWGNIVRWMSSNQTASSGGFREQVMSITNITTDDSNVERLNRWTCALRMSAEKPLFGFGPGTYQFLYAPYQSSYLLTSESSNQGKKGNAHSEYLGLMSESGLPAVLAFISIIVLTIAYAFRTANKLSRGAKRTMLMGFLIGFITYITHGVLNNFLDMDKLALLFWGTIAMVVAASSGLPKVEAKN